MILRSIILQLDGNKELVKNQFLGYYAYSFFINQIRKISKEKSEIYHKKNIKKPFTLSAPFLHDEKIFLRVCFLNDEIFSLFVSSLFETKIIKLKEDFKLKKVYLNQDKNLPQKVNRLIKVFSDDKNYQIPDFLTMKILSPLIFKKGLSYETIPSVDLIKNSFEKRQLDIYQKIIFPVPKFLIDKINLQSKAVKVEPFADFVGMVGIIKIKLEEKNSSIFALEFFGLGVKTTMGLGQLVIEKLA